MSSPAEQIVRDLLRMGCGLVVRGDRVSVSLPDDPVRAESVAAVVRRMLPRLAEHREEVVRLMQAGGCLTQPSEATSCGQSTSPPQPPRFEDCRTCGALVNLSLAADVWALCGRLPAEQRWVKGKQVPGLPGCPYKTRRT